MAESKFFKGETEGAGQEVVAEQVVPVAEDAAYVAAGQDLARRAEAQAGADMIAATKILKQIRDGEADVAARNSGWSENAARVEAAAADQVERDIINGEYKWDGNLTQAENMANMKRNEAGVAARNNAWKGQRLN